jgi:hypothetical protein
MLILVSAILFILVSLTARVGISSRPYGKSHHDAPGAAHDYDERLSYLVRGTR